MLRRFAYIVFAGLTFAAPAAAQDASTVAGRPTLSTTTTQDLIAQREKWGSAPGATGGTASGEPPPPEKAVKPAPSGRYAVLPTESTEKLIAEREKWGKGPAGYEKKKVAAPRAAGAGEKKLKRVKAKTKREGKKVAKKRKVKKKKN
jgi:hypothetical protein